MNLHIGNASATHLRIGAEPWMIQMLSDNLTFEVPGARHMPTFKNKMWDGKIRLLDSRSNTVPAGLLPRILSQAVHEGWDVSAAPEVWRPSHTEISDEEFNSFLDDINLPSKFREEFDGKYAFQVKAVKKAIQFGRRLILSPTGTGKSLIIYLTIMYYRWAGLTDRALVVSIATNLIRQMASDFVEYGCDPDDIHMVYEGQSKTADRPIVISTWQSMVNQPPQWSRRFDLLIGDEAHTYKSKVTGEMVARTTNAHYRFGLTGTLDGTETHLWVLEGAFGPVFRATTTKKAIESGVLAPLKVIINTIVYPTRDRELASKFATKDYDKEKRFIASHVERRNALCRYALSLPSKDNVLLLFKTKDKAAKLYFETLQQMAPGRDVYYVTGDVGTDEREVIRKQIEHAEGAIIVATYKVFSTGINIKRLNHLIPVEGIKSMITLLQSIGRILRKDGRQAVVHDLVDDLRCGVDQKPNFAYRHGIERIDIYDGQGFPYEFSRIVIAE